jgi:hypothetical protein
MDRDSGWISSQCRLLPVATSGELLLHLSRPALRPGSHTVTGRRPHPPAQGPASARPPAAPMTLGRNQSAAVWALTKPATLAAKGVKPAPWAPPTRSQPCRPLEAPPRITSCLSLAGGGGAVPAGSPAHPAKRWTDASTAATTTRPEPSRRSPFGSATRLTWIRCRPSWSWWSTTRCSLPRCRYGFGPRHRRHRVYKGEPPSLETAMTPCMPCSFGLFERARSEPRV